MQPSCPLPIPSGQVWLFRDVDLNSPYAVISTVSGLQNRPQYVPEDLNDGVSVAAWNLPVGTFVTLVEDNFDTVKDAHKSRTFDCFGTGNPMMANLIAFGVNDCLTSFFWDTYDPRMGTIELFDDVNKRGVRVILFLSKYEMNTNHSMEGWWISDRVTSMNWDPLYSGVEVLFYDNIDGTGRPFSEVFSWNPSKASEDLKGMSDRISCFKWGIRAPVKEEINGVFDLSLIVNDSPYVTSFSANADIAEQKYTLQIIQQRALSITCSVEDTYSCGWSQTLETSYTPPDETGGVGAKCSVTVTSDYSKTTGRSSTTTFTEDVHFSVEVTVPPKSGPFDAKLFVYMSNIDKQSYWVTGKRWYDMCLENCVEDGISSDGRPLYSRTENIPVTITGQVTFKSHLDVKGEGAANAVFGPIIDEVAEKKKREKQNGNK